MEKIIFSFGTVKYYPVHERLKNSVLNGNVDKLILCKEESIEPDFYKDCEQHFKHKRGFGFWVWKSYFINKFLKEAKGDEVFFYMDAGNIVMKDLTPLFSICNEDERGVVLFENTDGEPSGSVWKNNLWTKSDCFNLMGLTTPEYFLGNQVNASYILFRKTDFSVNFFEEYLKFCRNFNIISDAPNITENFNKDFKDHRHDQSILSLLSIKHNIKIIRDPSQFGNHRVGDNDGYDQLLHHYRIPV